MRWVGRWVWETRAQGGLDERGLHAAVQGGARGRRGRGVAEASVRNESLISSRFCDGWLITGLQRSGNKGAGR